MSKIEMRYLSHKHAVDAYPALSRFPELHHSLDRLMRNPQELLHMYGRYRSYVKKLTRLNDGDTEILNAIQKHFPSHRGAFNFIEKYGPERLHDSTGSPGLLHSLDEAVDPREGKFQAAFHELVEMMERAQTLTENPHDAPGTEGMIYGYRFIQDSPDDRYQHRKFITSMTHFVFCHAMERALFAKIRPSLGHEWKKDDFLGALGDVLLLMSEQGREWGEDFKPPKEYRTWYTKKADGGLGWIRGDYSNIAFDIVYNRHMQKYG